MNSIIAYLKNTRAEVRHISWPSRWQVMTLTFAVIAISLFIAGMLGLFDYMFTELVKLL